MQLHIQVRRFGDPGTPGCACKLSLQITTYRFPIRQYANALPQRVNQAVVVLAVCSASWITSPHEI
eukprot:8019672-Karenia_brevis.AAC.1